jgi:hypothetical protein
VAAGKPVAGARVTLVDGDARLDRTFAWGYDDASWEDMVRARTGADGWADFPALSFGGATVLVRAPGFARHRVGWRGREKDLTCALAPEAVLAGEVRGPAGRPVKEFYLRLSRGGDQVGAGAGPNDEGRFRVAELPAGTWEVTVLGTDGLSVLHREKVTLEAGKTRDLKIKSKKE